MEDNNARCLYCDALFATPDLLSRHMESKHNVIPAERMDFIPEPTYDGEGKRKPRPYKQKPYIPTSEYEG